MIQTDITGYTFAQPPDIDCYNFVMYGHDMASPKRTAKKADDAAEESTELFVRNIPPHVAAAIARWATEWTEERGTKVTRADVVRELLHRAVKRAEKGEAP